MTLQLCGQIDMFLEKNIEIGMLIYFGSSSNFWYPSSTKVISLYLLEIYFLNVSETQENNF